MCGFIVTRTKRVISETDLLNAEAYLSARGPNSNRLSRVNDGFGCEVLIKHFLLDISGSAAIQPVSDHNNAKHIVFNGEIYNYQELVNGSESDTNALKSLIFQNDFSGISKVLVGEYAIVFLETHTGTLYLLTDPFLTKPVFIARGHDPAEIGISSYGSALSRLGFHTIVCAEPNSLYSIKFGAGSLSIDHQFPVRPFKTIQESSSFSHWEEAFLESVRRRAMHGAHQPLVSLSSGYDSGGIALALNLLNIPYKTISISAGEDTEILKKRISQNSRVCKEASVIEGLSKKEQLRIKLAIRNGVEPLPYSHRDSVESQTELSEDGGAIGLYAVAEYAKRLGIKVTLSGSGADEIMSDYGFGGEKLTFHSEFGGRFPSSLERFFPWRKFYGDTQRSYLFKEEFILGSLGMEGRYPYLDTQLVQEFLSLDPELKNLEYKAPLANFLRKHDYAFRSGEKRGFSPGLQSTILSRSIKSWLFRF